MSFPNRLPIISSYDYFNSLVNIVIRQKRELYGFVKFIDSYDIKFNFYKSSYDINNLYKNYEHKVHTAIKDTKNYNLDFFYDENESIIRIYHNVLKNEKFEIGRFLGSIIMSATARSQKDKEIIEKIKWKLYNDKVVQLWTKQNQNTLLQQIFDKCHEV